jgi:hypothetical protein
VIEDDWRSSNIAPLRAKAKAEKPYADLPLSEQVVKLRALFPLGHTNHFKVGDVVRYRPEARPHVYHGWRDLPHIVVGVRQGSDDKNFYGDPEDDLRMVVLTFTREEQAYRLRGVHQPSCLFELVDRAPDPWSEDTAARSQGTEDN